MSLQLHFAELLPGARMVRANAFRLYEVDGHYPLPNLVLRTVADIDSIALQSLHVHAVEGVSGELEHWLGNEWMPSSRPVDRVTARAEVTSGIAVPTIVVDQSLPEGDPEVTSRGRAVVTWNLAFTDPTGRAGDSLVPVVLDFTRAGVPAPQSEPAPEIWTWRALRHRSAESSLKTFAAVDFGTSSSTVTLYDARRPDPYLIDPEQARELRSLLAELLNDAPPQDTPAAAEWEFTLGQLRSSLATRFPHHNLSTVAAVADALRVDSASTDLLHAVCAELDQALAGELSEWLAARLHHSYDTAFQVPALTSLRLRPVLFDKDNDLYDTPSVLAVTQLDPLEAQLLDNQSKAGDKVGEQFRDLKRRFSDRETDALPGLRDPDGGEVTIDHLVAYVYELLTSKTEQFAHDSEKQRLDRLPRLVVTYPTTTTPFNRARLNDLIKQSLDLAEVITKYDEGVAAGLYFLMRDFGGHQALGVEALRANSWRIAAADGADNEPPQWRQIMLVIDIGGGTTDIALIGLTLTDLTPDLPETESSVKGRYYRIEPEVLGSAGHPLLGGDYLTLRVFYWLKAAIIDAMVTGGPDSSARTKLIDSLPDRFRPGPQRLGSLAQIVVSGDAKEPAPEEIAHELRGLLNTRWTTNDPNDRAAFWQLWTEAEEAKKVLGGGRPYVMAATEIKKFLGRIADDTKPAAELIPEKGVTLDPQSFARLIRPALEMAIDFAAHLVKGRLAKLPDARLDRVMLSGKTSLMPLVREVTASWLTGLVAERPDGWRAGAVPTVEVEELYAKEAASLGACWAQSVVQHGAPRPDAAEVAAGRTVVSISVDNLFTALPSNFYRNIGAGRFTVLEIGAPFTELDAVGSLGVRAKGWDSLPRTYELQRELGPDLMLRWGHFTFVDYAQGFSYNHTVWGGDQGAVPTMEALLELDQACVPKLYLCNNGQPHFVARSRSLNLLSTLLRHPHGGQYVDKAENRLNGLPTLVVRTGRGSKNDPLREETVLDPWDNSDLVFPLFVHASDDPDSAAVPGVVRPLPPASYQHGGYTFALVFPDRTEVELGELPVPGKWGPRARYSATLTVDGHLRVHRGELPFLTATTMAEVERREGTVLTVHMEEDHSDLNPSWRPFTGKH